LSSQDGRVYAFNAETGALAWVSDPLAPTLQGHPSGVFTTFGGTRDLVFVGTRDPAGSRFYALRLSDGKALSPGWVFDGVSAGFGKIGVISGQAAVDQTTRRVYFASRAFDGTNNNTVWCVDLETGAGLWARPHGDIDSGVSAYNGRLLVGTSAPVRTVKSIDTVSPNEGVEVWSFTIPPAEGPVKGYVTVDRFTGELYFSTRDKVWALRSDGTPKWLPSGDRALGSQAPPALRGRRDRGHDAALPAVARRRKRRRGQPDV
jgi:outer membrane protein assembly factor BamB